MKQPFTWHSQVMERVSGLMRDGDGPKVGEAVIAVDPFGDRRRGVVESLAGRGHNEVRVIVARIRPI